MKKKGMLRLAKRIVAGMLGLVVCVSTIGETSLVVHATENTGATVTTKEEFLAALEQKKSPIIVNGVISADNGADATGKMYPVYIPEGTVIRGGIANSEGEGPSLSFRSPIQLTGSNVVIENIQMQFSSATALGSVPHREIFLAGHSLTLDNVSTYQEGAGGSLGGLGGSESELLPTVYAGAFEGTTVGTTASLTIRNANEDSVLQAIYMGHDTGTDSKVAYTGQASLQIGEKVSIRDGIFTEGNSSASIEVIGEGEEISSNNLNNVSFYGNADTTLTVKNICLNKTTISNVGNLVLDENAVFELSSGAFNNITVKNGACLNLNGVQDVIASGYFMGGAYDEENSTDTRGTLVLNEEGSLTIEGIVKGETLLQTEDKNFPGDYLEKTYVYSAGCENGAVGFVLPDTKNGSYELTYENNNWMVKPKNLDTTVTEIEVVSHPSVVDINTIIGTDFVPAENAPYCEIIWKDADGNALDAATVDAMMLYYFDKIIAVKTEYWESEENSAETDWANPIEFAVSVDAPGKYYFYVDELNTAMSGDYTFILLSESREPQTFAEVKSLKDEGLILAEFEVTFYNSANGETAPDPTPEPMPNPDPELIDISSENITVSTIEDQVYTGEEICPEVIVRDGERFLVNGTDYTLSYLTNVKAGDASVIITGINDYTGTREATFTILPADINNERIWVETIEDQEYTGEMLKPVVNVYDGYALLMQGKDYSLTYVDNINVGTARVIIEGKGDYTGTRETAFNITAAPDPDPEPDPEPTPDPDPNPDPDPMPDPEPEDKEGLWFEIVDEEPFYYNGKAIKPAVKVYEGEQELGAKDYKISYSNNKNAGAEAKITVTGKGNYTGKDSIYFTIEKKDIGDADITAPKEVFAVIQKDGSVRNPKVTLKLGKSILKANTTKATRDYAIDYQEIPKNENNKAVAGEYVITVSGNGMNFTGNRTIKYKVIEDTTLQMGKAKITIAKNSPIKKIDYTKPDVLPDFVVKIRKTELKKDIDYKIVCPEFTVGKNVITFEPVETSQYSLYGTKNYTVTVTGAPIKHKDILIEGISPDGYDYTGSEIIPGENKDGKNGLSQLKVSKVTTRDEAGNVTAVKRLTENVDYVLSYKNNKKAGKATVTITGINGYTGKRSVNFMIRKIDLRTARPELLQICIADSAVYSKNGAKAEVSVSYNGIPLVEKKDYILTYKDHKKVGEHVATVIVKGKGSFTNYITAKYSVVSAGSNEVRFTADDIVRPLSVTKVKPRLTVIETATNKKLSAKTDYIKDVKYYSDEACTKEITTQDLVVGKELWARIILKGNYGDGETTMLKDSFRLYGAKASVFKVETIEPQPYTGKPVTLDLNEKVYVYVKTDGVKQKVVLTEGTHYYVEYPEGKNVKAGTGKAVLHGMGEYGGTKTISFRISKKSVKFNLGEAILDLLFR